MTPSPQVDMPTRHVCFLLVVNYTHDPINNNFVLINYQWKTFLKFIISGFYWRISVIFSTINDETTMPTHCDKTFQNSESVFIRLICGQTNTSCNFFFSICRLIYNFNNLHLDLIVVENWVPCVYLPYTWKDLTVFCLQQHECTQFVQ